MAGNMPQMGGAAQMMPGGRGPPRNNNVLQQFVFQQILQHQPQFDPMSWQASAPIELRVTTTINLYELLLSSQVLLANN